MAELEISNIECLVADYIDYRFRKEGFQYRNSINNNCHENDKMATVIRNLCDEFEIRYGQQFGEVTAALVPTKVEYDGVLGGVFQDGISWRRIVAMMSFAGVMSVQCLRQGHEDRVKQVFEWTCEFMHQHLETWIKEHNGLRGLLEFYEAGQPNVEPDRTKSWATFLLGGAIGGALGAVAMGALAISRH